MLKRKDINQLEEQGISEEEFNHYIDLLKAGAKPTELVRPATLNDGIIKLSAEDIKKLEDLWNTESPRWDIERFIPASGAATRMFKEFYDYLQEGTDTPGVTLFFKNLEKFSFYKSLGLERCPESQEEKRSLLKFLLSDTDWNWSQLPKGLLPFHLIADRLITPFEEHLREGSLSASGKNVFLHFTVSPKHKKLFEKQAKEIIPLLEQKFGLNYRINYSFQDSSTNTPALNDREEPFRTEDGALLFRPGGHGSLIRNLNKLESDIIFLKNIDNVGTGEYREISAQWFRLFGALLIRARKELALAEKDLRNSPNKIHHDAAIQVLNTWGGVVLDGGEDTRQLLKRLNRPVRICGMVRNDGDTGGGPFWVIDERGDCSLQIVESAQFDKNKPEIARMLQSITHFNPVFLACSPKNCRGEKVDLEDFVDRTAVFTSEKSLQGRKLKALEHPGLWNGSMAYWNTTFVEIPLNCFNPVKSLTDLLMKAHGSEKKG